jgi:hypothetical protein
LIEDFPETPPHEPRLAEGTVDITEVWDGELVIEGVPLDSTPERP